jgi:hypothetical protein
MSLEYPCVYFDHEKCTLHGTEPESIDWCVMGPCSKETPSNADHIRSMTDEELADFMSAFCEMSDDCKKCPLFGRCPESDQACWWEEWLKQPYKEDL